MASTSTNSAAASFFPMVNWGDDETTGLRQFDDWCAAALAKAQM